MQLAVGPLARRQLLDEPCVAQGDRGRLREQSCRLDLELAEGIGELTAHPEDSAGRAVVHDRDEHDRACILAE